MTRSTPAAAGTRSTAVAARWLTAATAALVAGSSVAGLWVPDLYTDSAAVEAMLRGYDLVTLAVVAPLLALTMLTAWRDRATAVLVRCSLFAYCVYNYAYYLFGAKLSAALLAHVLVFATSLYALVLSLVAMDVRRLAARFRARTPVRTVAVILILLGLPLAALQVSGLAGYAVTGTVPQEPSQLVVPLEFTRLGAVLDLSLLVPAYLLAAIWVWHRRAFGLVLATVVLLAGAVHQISYMAGMIFQMTADIAGASFDPYEPFILALFAIGSGLLLLNLRPAEPDSSSRRPVRARVLTGR